MRSAVVGMTAALMIAIGAMQGGIAGGLQKDPSVSSGWVKLPPAGATTTDAYATVQNPTMYAFYLVSASCDAAGTVELRQTGRDAALTSVTVEAYSSLAMEPQGIHLRLKDLEKPLAEGDKINLTVVTEVGAKLSVEAIVRKE